MKLRWIVPLAASALLSACDKKHDHEHKHDDQNTHGQPVKVADSYASAVSQCEELSGKIPGLISANKHDDLHETAEQINKIAERLPELAQKAGLSGDMLKQVNVKSKELGSLFHDIDEAAHAHKMDDVRKHHERMKAIIAELKGHADHKR